MNRFLSEIQEKYTELVQIAFRTEIFNRLVFPKKCMKFNRFSHPMTYIIMIYYFGDSLEPPNLLLLVVCPKIAVGGQDLQIFIWLEKECSFRGADNVRWWGHSNTTRW